MHKRSKQTWTIGETVKVGFLTLIITGHIPTPGDYKPNIWTLTSLDGTKQYEFTPHYGLVRTNP